MRNARPSSAQRPRPRHRFTKYEETLGQPVLNVRIVRPGSTLARGRPIMCGAVPEVQQQ